LVNDPREDNVSDHLLTTGPYGFAWGPAEVVRCTDHKGGVVITVKTEAGLGVDVYVSARGQSIRVFNKGRELKMPADL
jgi:hypothetical protein